MPTTTASAELKWDVLVTNRQGLTRDLPPGKEQWTWVPTSATLIFGQRDAVLVDAFLTVEQAAALVEWGAASGKSAGAHRHQPDQQGGALPRVGARPARVPRFAQGRA